MKLKPLIKTHWLASQNPMLIPLGGLKRIVFLPASELLDFQFNGTDEAKVVLNSTTPLQVLAPAPDEIQEVRARSHSFSRDLFWTLFSGHDLPFLRTPPAFLRQLVQSVEFHYEGGERLSLLGIFRKPGLPLFLNPQFYLQDPSCGWSKVEEKVGEELMKPLKIFEHQKKNDDFKKAWIILLEMLAWALQRQRQVGDLEVVWAKNSQLEDCFHLKDLEFVKARPLVATVMAAPGVPQAARIRVWQGLESLDPHNTLRLHAIGALSELENSLSPQVAVDQAEEQALVAPGQTQVHPIHWQSRFVSTEMGAKDITRVLSKIEQSLGSEKVIFVRHTQVMASDFKPRLRVRESDGSLQMGVSFGIDSLKLEHLNFPASLLPALAPFYGGLDTFFKLDRIDVASKQNQFRTNDLLFLRHQGLTLFCLLETVNWVLNKPLSSGESIEFIEDQQLASADVQFEKFIKYLKSSIPGLLGKPGTDFEELVSTRVKGYFVNFVDLLFQALIQDRNLIFHQDQVMEIKNTKHQVYPLIRFLILHFMESSQGKFLTRAQAPVGDSFKEALRLWTEPKLLNQDAILDLETALWVDVGIYNKYMISLLFELCDQGFEIEFNGTPFLALDNPFEFILSVGDTEQKEDTHWFDLHPQIFFNGTRIASEEVKFNFGQGQAGFIEYRGQMYRIDKKQMPSLKSLQKFWDRIKGIKQTSKHNTFGEKVYRLPKSQALELLMLRSQGIEVQGHGEWKRIFDYYENGLGVEKIQLSDEMQKKLLPHQKDGAQWLHDLYELRLGAILADEMGLGKTFQVLSFMISLQLKKKLKKCLIVVPTSLVYNWMDEKKKFAPDLPMRVFHSPEKNEIKKSLESDEPLVLITTYGLVNENPEFFQGQEWNILVFDEAQNLKNITSLRSVSARQLTADFKVCVTGTPMENNYLEFFSLCDLVVPGCLGNIDLFRKQYFNREVRTESLRELRLISKPLLLRRTKEQVQLSLPVKTIHKVLLPFNEKQKEIYKKMAMTFSRQVEDLIQEQGERKAQIAMFAALMRLRQICSDPAAVPGVIYDERPAKVEHFISSLQEHLENNESVIVFTQFLSTLGRIRGELEKLKVPAFVLQGNVSAKDRVGLISAFQDYEGPAVMLMTLKTGGVGLNLTKASVVYHLEPWWNPAVENQATDRAHRMGQTKDVKVYNLLIEGSLEERIADLKIKKQGSFDRLFGVDEEVEGSQMEGSHALSREDFIYLLK